MRVRTLFFASYKEIVGTGELWLELPDGSTVSDAVEDVRGRGNDFAVLPADPAVAVNQTYAQATQPLTDGDELAFMNEKKMMAVTHGRGIWLVDTFNDCNGNRFGNFRLRCNIDFGPPQCNRHGVAVDHVAMVRQDADVGIQPMEQVTNVIVAGKHQYLMAGGGELT